MRSRRLDVGLAATSFLTISGISAAVAPVTYAAPWGRTYSAAFNVGFRFGGEGDVRFVFGLEGMGVYLDHPHLCGGDAQTYAGAVARLEGAVGEGPRLLLGPVVGRTNGTAGYAADAALGYAFGRNPGVVAAAGATGSFAYLFDMRLAVSSRFDGQAVGALRFPPLSTSGLCVVGRPLRRDGGRAPLAGATQVRRGRTSNSTPDALRSDPHARKTAHRGAERAGADEAARAGAGRIWLDRARMEWASVPAFLELGRQLTALGAPAALVERARAAAADELRHAVLSGELAATLGDLHLLDLDPPAPTPARPLASGRSGLVRLAAESFVDGCVGEAAAADQAAREADLATAPTVARVLRAIAADEAQHAVLAWDVLTWALGADGAAVRPALRAAVSAMPEVRVASVPAVAAYGVLDGSTVLALHADRRARSITRLRAALG